MNFNEEKIMIFNSRSFAATSFLVCSQVLATMTPNLERGEKNIYYNSSNGVQEVCVIPTKYPLASYKKNDIKNPNSK